MSTTARRQGKLLAMRPLHVGAIAATTSLLGLLGCNGAVRYVDDAGTDAAPKAGPTDARPDTLSGTQACDDGTGATDCCPVDGGIPTPGAPCSPVGLDCWTPCFSSPLPGSGQGVHVRKSCTSTGWNSGHGLFACNLADGSMPAEASALAETSVPVDSPAPLRDAPASFAVDRWMEDSSATIGHRPLSRLLLPGTHDSATYALVPTSSRPASDPFAPDAVDLLVRLGSLTNVTAAWSQTQDKSIGAQLLDGVRTLDLRVCLDKSDTFRLCHGLYGPTLHEVLQDLRAFATTHPKEIVVLFIDGFTDWTPTAADAGPAYGNMSAANIDRVKAALEQELADVLLDHSSASPESTLDAIWAGQPRRTVAVVFERNPSAPFWGSDRLTNSWRDTWHEDDKKASLESALAADVLRCTLCGTIFEFSGEVTEDATLIELSFLSSRFPASLRDLADVANPVILGWLRDAWTPLGYRMNAVQVDFYDRSCLVPLVLSLNGIDALPLSGCSIGTSTAWGSYWNEALGATCIPDEQCQSKHCAGVCVACKSSSDCGAGHVCLGATCL